MEGRWGDGEKGQNGKTIDDAWNKWKKTRNRHEETDHSSAYPGKGLCLYPFASARCCLCLSNHFNLPCTYCVVQQDPVPTDMLPCVVRTCHAYFTPLAISSGRPPLQSSIRIAGHLLLLLFRCVTQRSCTGQSRPLLSRTQGWMQWPKDSRPQSRKLQALLTCRLASQLGTAQKRTAQGPAQIAQATARMGLYNGAKTSVSAHGLG